MGLEDNRTMTDGSDYREAERERVRRMLERDAEDRRAEEVRLDAERAVANGAYVRIVETTISPTPEWLGKGDVEPYVPRQHDRTIAEIRTVRRRYAIDQIAFLHGRGVIDDRQRQACLWYREKYEAGQVGPDGGAVASYGETVRAGPLYGHLPRTHSAAEARSEYRMAARSIPEPLIAVFEAVVIANVSLADVGRTIRRAPVNVRAAFLVAVDLLCGEIAHMLDRERW